MEPKTINCINFRQTTQHASAKRADTARRHAALHPRAGQPVGGPHRQRRDHHHAAGDRAQQTRKASGDVRGGYGGGHQSYKPSVIFRHEHPHPHYEASAALAPTHQGNAPGYPVRPHRAPLREDHLMSVARPGCQVS
ncbi:hypothetical protein ACJJTC_011162 [Scirpophaga incertulas]